MPNSPIFVTRGSYAEKNKEETNEEFDYLRKTGDISVLANHVFWHFWSRRCFPYQTLEEGQTLYLVDTLSREIAAELRVTAIAREHYTDPGEAYETLDKVFGLGSEVADRSLFNRDAPEKGYLFAVAADPVAYIGKPIDINWAKVGGRGGWASYDTAVNSTYISEEAREVIRSLPPEGRPVAVHSYPIDLSSAHRLADLPRAPRMPTATVAKEISKRAKGKCEMQGCDGKAEHLDHKFPWAHGGSSEAVNLQWLCAEHNLRKSDKIPEHYTADQLWLRFRSSFTAEDGFVIGDNL